MDARELTTENTEKPQPRRRWRTLLWAVPLALVLLVVAVPYVLALAPFRDMVLGAAMTDANGTVTSSGARLGWFSPVAFYDVEVRPPEGPPLLTIPACEGDTPLWRLLVGGGNLGAYRLVNPQVRLALMDGGSNFKTVFAKEDEDEDVEELPTPDPAKQVPGISISVEIAGGKFAFAGNKSAKEWTLGDLNVTCQLKPGQANGEGPRLVVLPGRLIDRVELTPEICNDMLSYAAPVLSGVTRVGGKFSVQLDECVMPLGDLAGAKSSGTIEIHAIDVGPGRLTARMADAFAVPPVIQLSRASHVKFRQVDGRIYHEDLEFTLGRLTIRTSGSVGVDETLDLTAEIVMPQLDVTDAPLREALSGRTFTIPIRGTLKRPEVDPMTMASSGINLAVDMLQELLGDETLSLDAVLERLRNRGWRAGGDAESDSQTGRILPEGLLNDGAGLRQFFQNRRRERQQSNSSSPSATEDDGAESLEPPAPDRPRRRLFNRRRRQPKTPEPPKSDEPSVIQLQ